MIIKFIKDIIVAYSMYGKFKKGCFNELDPIRVKSV